MRLAVKKPEINSTLAKLKKTRVVQVWHTENNWPAKDKHSAVNQHKNSKDINRRKRMWNRPRVGKDDGTVC